MANRANVCQLATMPEHPYMGIQRYIYIMYLSSSYIVSISSIYLVSIYLIDCLYIYILYSLKIPSKIYINGITHYIGGY